MTERKYKCPCGCGSMVPRYAAAIELRRKNKALDAKFARLPDKKKWEWLLVACKAEPEQAVKTAQLFVQQAA